jgi:hypothetical protein
VTLAQPRDLSYAPEEARPLSLEPGDLELSCPEPWTAAQSLSRILLASGPQSAKAAREFTAATLRGWQLDALIDDAVIVASELVTNAIRHGTCLAGDGLAGDGLAGDGSAGDGSGQGQVELSWRCQASRVICVVTDGSAQPPVSGSAGPDAVSGRGLQVVQALAAAWGWTMLSTTQKAVWAALHFG